jgi:hypothetical protein
MLGLAWTNAIELSTPPPPLGLYNRKAVLNYAFCNSIRIFSVEMNFVKYFSSDWNCSYCISAC